MALRIHEIAGGYRKPAPLKAAADLKLILLLQPAGGAAALGEIVRSIGECNLVSISEAAGFADLVQNCRPDLIIMDLALAREIAGPSGGTFGRTKGGKATPVIGIARRDTPPPPAYIRDRIDLLLTLPLHREQVAEALKQWL